MRVMAVMFSALILAAWPANAQATPQTMVGFMPAAHEPSFNLLEIQSYNDAQSFAAQLFEVFRAAGWVSNVGINNRSGSVDLPEIFALNVNKIDTYIRIKAEKLQGIIDFTIFDNFAQMTLERQAARILYTGLKAGNANDLDLDYYLETADGSRVGCHETFDKVQRPGGPLSPDDPNTANDDKHFRCILRLRIN